MQPAALDSGEWNKLRFNAALAAMLLVPAACSDSAAPRVSEPEELEVRWVSIAAGGHDFTRSTCGLTDTGTAYCWGDNGSGQLGLKSFDESRTPAPVSGGLRFRSIAPGSRHTCAIATENTVYCWGDWGRLPLGSLRDSLAVPRAVIAGQPLSSLTSASQNSCVLTADGTAICWSGQATHANYGIFPQPLPIGGETRFKSISAGIDYTTSPFWCGLAVTESAYCWGSNFSGALGIGVSGAGTSKRDPTPVAGGLRFKSLAAGYITCGITHAGPTLCWGNEASYPPFQNNVAGGLVPTLLRGGIAFEALSIGRDHACGITAAGTAYCWGANEFGQLGAGSNVSGSNMPLLVAGGVVFNTVSAGNSYTCGTTSDGKGYCWGSDFAGELGIGSAKTPSPYTNFSRVPVKVRGPRTAAN